MKEVINTIHALIRDSGGFVAAWGANESARLDELRAFFPSKTLPVEYECLLLEFANLQIGYWPIQGLGPLYGMPAALSLTCERRSEWPALPHDRLVIGERGTDMITLCADGRVEVRTESSRDLAVFKTFSSFLDFLKRCVADAIEDAIEIGQLPADYPKPPEARRIQ